MKSERYEDPFIFTATKVEAQKRLTGFIFSVYRIYKTLKFRQINHLYEDFRDLDLFQIKRGGGENRDSNGKKKAKTKKIVFWERPKAS